eukprot:gnl/Chilomastix_caulleri/2407.p2 GENE.gnl/Chilomastix_caulleri/2407~~gnl/Chilomastix_caulleri/2407.p2  ORF type:complete len:76 (+),score=4.46 gnl/Chilomastix_caulleri/2407:256-483(+)
MDTMIGLRLVMLTFAPPAGGLGFELTQTQNAWEGTSTHWNQMTAHLTPLSIRVGLFPNMVIVNLAFFGTRFLKVI